MFVPDDPPAVCPACGDGYDSVSRHADGFVVNLLDNDRYRRVCFAPATVDGAPALDCFHHTHAAAMTGKSPDSAGENEPIDDVAAADAPTDTVAAADAPTDTVASDDAPTGDGSPTAVNPTATERS